MDQPAPKPIFTWLSRFTLPGNQPISLTQQDILSRQLDQGNNVKPFTIISSDGVTFATTEKIARQIPLIEDHLELEPNVNSFTLAIPSNEYQGFLGAAQFWPILQFVDYHSAIPYQKLNTKFGIVHVPPLGFDASICQTISSPEQLVDLIHAAGYLGFENDSNFMDLLMRCVLVKVPMEPPQPDSINKLASGFARARTLWDIRVLCTRISLDLLLLALKHGNEVTKEIFNVEFFRHRCRTVNQLDDKVIFPVQPGQEVSRTISDSDIRTYLDICKDQGELYSPENLLTPNIAVALRTAFLVNNYYYAKIVQAVNNYYSMGYAKKISQFEIFIILSSKSSQILQNLLENSVKDVKNNWGGNITVLHLRDPEDIEWTEEMSNVILKYRNLYPGIIDSIILGYLNLPPYKDKEYKFNPQRYDHSQMFYIIGQLKRLAKYDKPEPETIKKIEELSVNLDLDELPEQSLLHYKYLSGSYPDLIYDTEEVAELAFLYFSPKVIKLILQTGRQLVFRNSMIHLNQVFHISFTTAKDCGEMLKLIEENAGRIVVTPLYLLLLKIISGQNFSVDEFLATEQQYLGLVTELIFVVAHPQIRDLKPIINGVPTIISSDRGQRNTSFVLYDPDAVREFLDDYDNGTGHKYYYGIAHFYGDALINKIVKILATRGQLFQLRYLDHYRRHPAQKTANFP